ncbi:leucine-rich repeat-containing G-protein coupled receptor 4 [Plakobranchus ocellatus]|uniref:Leucine-rich repeat-containing G-protein coupled receptor 4 n=1 Tax=Plakobranchus ocellatus TaxID=259542 RepID=A0AAV4CGP1_9GAST|nr:leucine-rich repeat-containing G-protein coupled receptor 4 [Plakobranchus ocellatus]
MMSQVVSTFQSHVSSTLQQLRPTALTNISIPLLLLLCTPILAAPVDNSSGMQQQQQQNFGGTPCPAACECPGEFYVYCQSAGLENHHLAEIVSQISTSVVLLDLSANQITSLQPEAFKRLPNLQYLYLSANGIEEIPTKAFRCLFWLKHLTLHGNKISSMHADSFFDLIRIQDLNLAENNISQIPQNTFTNLKTLEKLNLEKNSFSELRSYTFLGLESLQLLNISHNALSFVQSNTFANLAKLKHLDLSHNSLDGLSVSALKGLSSLLELNLDWNFIRNMTFLGNSNNFRSSDSGNVIDFQQSLNRLSLSGNRLEKISSQAFSSLVVLRQLILSHNAISILEPEAFADLLLDRLSLKENALNDLDRDVFSGVRRISELDMSANRIAGFSPGIFDTFRQNSPFSIDLSDNLLTYIHTGLFREMRTLRVLNLSGNLISVIDSGALNDLELLEELDLSRNRLVLVTPEMVSGPTETLRKLNLIGNPLKHIQGFTFYDQNDRILIESEAKLSASSSTWAVITWPYKDGSQLYWSLTVTCDSRAISPSQSSSVINTTPDSLNSSPIPENTKDDQRSCKKPADDKVLEPFRNQINISNLRPDTRYTACVLPVFVSPDVVVSQCVHMRTKQGQPPTTQNTIVDGEPSTNSAESQKCFLHFTGFLSLTFALCSSAIRHFLILL